MSILSLQSRVVCGGVGNAIAAFALRRIGCEVWPIDTVVLSNHPGHGSCRGQTRSAAEIDALIDGLALLGLLPRCRAVLSGYLGSVDNGHAVRRAVRLVRAAQPDAVWCCDPVMGDRREGVYVAEPLVEFFRAHATEADVLTPNHFELELLAQRPLSTLAAVLDVVDQMRAAGIKTVLVSSVSVQPEGPNRRGRSAMLGTLLASATGVWLAETPELSVIAKGTGDLLAALFLGRWLSEGDQSQALAAAVASTCAVLERTPAEALDLALTENQDVLTAPPGSVSLRRLR